MLMTPIEDQTMFFFEDEITFYYEVLAEHDTAFDCGDFAIEFLNVDGTPLDLGVFSDGSDTFET